MLEEIDWWNLAVELEHQDRLAEAEDVIEKAMRPHGTPWPAQIAHLYELRAQRLFAEGNPAAKEAAQQAVNFMREYASGATSGGEGVALSAEADQVQQRFEKLLGVALNRWS